MIGRRGFQIVETLRASSGSGRVRLPFLGKNHSPSIAEDRQWLRITLPQHERAPPELTRVAGNPQDCCRPGPIHGSGPAEGAASPGKPISTRIDYGTESVVTSHTTSARAQCKSPVGRSSCGIVAGGRATSVIRASEGVP
jgi:hypothetical protein